MPDTRQTKIAVLGWFMGLEGEKKTSWWKRKAQLYWSRIQREADVRWWSEAATMGQGRDRWRDMIEERTEHLWLWERSRGNMVEEERSMEKNGEIENVEAFQCKVCGKICKSRGGQGIHRMRMHGELHQLLDFRWRQCNERFSSDNTKVNHEKVCGGIRVESANRRRCWMCSKDIWKANIARPVRAWKANEAEGGVRGNVRPE